MREAPEKSQRHEPDLTICRTSPIQAAWLRHQPLISNCLVEKEDCKYALSFAYGCLCKHPRHLELAVPRTPALAAFGRAPARGPTGPDF